MKKGTTFPCPNLVRILESIHFRHLHVHKNYVESIPIERREGFGGISRHHRQVAMSFDNFPRVSLVDQVIFGDQDEKACARGLI